MSFKDVRDLSEHLKLLGYPKKFPLQILYTNYGSLNAFKVVADILQWLTNRLDPGSNLAGGCGNENNRILLIRAATEFFVTKSSIKLNPRKLYASNTGACKELQKITSVLLTAPSESNDDNEDSTNFKSLSMVDLGDKIDDLRRARELSSELTKRGAIMYDLLSKELLNKEIRIQQSSRPMELSSVERTLKNAISSIQIKLQTAKQQLETARVERNAGNSKLERKKAELDRSKQRLDALQKIRPAYLEEFEQLEEELKILFQDYFIRVQCRDSLKAHLELKTKMPTPLASPISSNKPAENSMTLIPEGILDDDDDDEDEDDIDGNKQNFENDKSDFQLRKQSSPAGSRRIRPTTGRLKPRANSTIGRRKVIGTMLGDSEDMLGSSSGSESDSDLELGVQAYDLPSDDDISLSKLTSELMGGNKKPNIKNLNENQSDDDF